MLILVERSPLVLAGRLLYADVGGKSTKTLWAVCRY